VSSLDQSVLVDAALARVYKEQIGRIVATLIRVLGDFSLAEEIAHEAFAAALEQWPTEGPPDNPAGWLVQTARHKAVDEVRRRAIGRRKLQEAALVAEVEASFTTEEEEGSDVPDDRLRLIFTCCHPALAPEVQVALTLRTLGGLTTEEIARAFLVPVPTMAQRLVRAKAKIQGAKIPYQVPPASALPERVQAVMAVVYLVFTEGYAATAGDAFIRRDLCSEAIRLGRLLARLLPGEPEVLGLLALMLLHDSRRDARVDAAGDLVLLEEQDRARWDRAQIDEGSRWSRRRSVARAPRPARMRSRPRSRPATRAPSARARPTGPRSRVCTTSSRGSTLRSWSCSTGRSRARWCAAPRSVSASSTRSAATGTSTATTCSTPPAPTSCAASGGRRRRPGRTSVPSASLRVTQSGASWSGESSK
jgi:RNA polymerase sigma factor (sigma-70 family)